MRLIHRLCAVLCPASFLGLAVLLALQPALAVQVRPLNLEQMTERAERVFHGRCLELRRLTDPVLERPVVEARFEVLRTAKGESSPELTIRLLAAEDAAGHRLLAGMPSFESGEEVVLFLYGESELGLTSPVGIVQGKFSVVEDKSGRKFAVNAYGNRHLSRELSADATRRLGAEVETLRAEREVEVDRLLDWATRLQASGRAGGAR
jgi:hypothetical protein